MIEWQSKQYNGQGYVEIRPSQQTAQQNPDFKDTRLYYAVSAKSLLLTPSETLLKNTLDRHNAEADTRRPEQADTQPATASASPWLGKHMNLKVDIRALHILRALFDKPMEQAMQQRGWSNLPILNEWKRRYPDRDPVQVHAEVWGQRLISPSGGGYEWSDKLHSMVSTNYGHPLAPKQGPVLPAALSEFQSGNFGLTFEDDGLRAEAQLQRNIETKQPQ